MDVAATVSFLKEIEKFKTCERVCQTSAEGRAESDAEHSWHLALLLLLLEEEFDQQEIDHAKALKMSLIHDLPELYAGDTNPYRDDVSHKEEEEITAAEKLFSALPHPAGEKLLSLFMEYAEQQTLESKIVKSADKLMPLIQNLCTNKQHSSYRKSQVEFAEVTEYLDPYFSGGPLDRLYRNLLEEAEREGVFHRA